MSPPEKVSPLDQVTDSIGGSKDSPFEELDSQETPLKYPEDYQALLEEDWSQICHLMEWGSLKVECFKRAKDPFAVVKTIQEKILSQGGDLGSHGPDGRYGMLTHSAMNQVYIQETSDVLIQQAEEDPMAKDRAPSNPASRKPKPTSSPDHPLQKEGFKKWILKWMTHLPEAMDTLEKAGLKLPKNHLEDPHFGAPQRAAFQDKIHDFQDKLIEENVALKSFKEKIDPVMELIQKEIESIDFSKIHTLEDLARLGEGKKEVFEKIVNDFSQALESAKGIEEKTLHLFLASEFFELEVSLTDYARKNQRHIKRMLKSVFREAIHLLQAEPSPPINPSDYPALFYPEKYNYTAEFPPRKSSRKLPLDSAKKASEVQPSQAPRKWSELKNQGQVFSGKIVLWHRGRRIGVNLNRGKLWVGVRKVFKGEEIKSAQFLENDQGLPYLRLTTSKGLKEVTLDELIDRRRG